MCKKYENCEGGRSMACFLVPTTEAVVTTIASKVIQKKEKTNGETFSEVGKVSFSSKLNWLSKLLWGGSALLCYEHLWHGEVVPFFPFLTAALDPAETKLMLHEMATVGGSMAVLLTAVWAGMVFVVNRMQKKVSDPALSKEE